MRRQKTTFINPWAWRMIPTITQMQAAIKNMDKFNMIRNNLHEEKSPKRHMKDDNPNILGNYLYHIPKTGNFCKILRSNNIMQQGKRVGANLREQTKPFGWDVPSHREEEGRLRGCNWPCYSNDNPVTAQAATLFLKAYSVKSTSMYADTPVSVTGRPVKHNT